MRPPQNAGENGRTFATQWFPSHGFNEAPAKRGGKRCQAYGTLAVNVRFNEAPAKRGGKHADWYAAYDDGDGFNEAPAKRGGKH